MSNRRDPAAYLRYFQSRLLNVRQPGVWVTAIFLVLVGVFIREYWLNPEIFTQQQNNYFVKPSSANSATEDEAAIADIDNLKVFSEDSKQGKPAAAAKNPQTKPQQNTNKSLLPDLIKPKPVANNSSSSSSSFNVSTAPREQNLFILQAENLLQMGTGYSNKSLTTSSDQSTFTTPAQSQVGLTNTTNTNQNSVVVSPLQAAINQATSTNIPNYNQVTANPTSTVQGTNYGVTTITPQVNNSASSGYIQPTVTNLQPTSPTNFNNPQVLSNVTPVTQPVTSNVPNNFSPYATQTPNQNAIAPTPVENYNNYPVQQPTPVAEPSVSRPRPTAGAYGGIEINGYRYP